MSEPIGAPAPVPRYSDVGVTVRWLAVALAVVGGSVLLALVFFRPETALFVGLTGAAATAGVLLSGLWFARVRRVPAA